MAAMAVLAAFATAPAMAVDGDAIRILVLGDSIAAGYGLPPDRSFPARLQDKLKAEGHAVKVINAGVSGDTTAGGRARLDWALADKPEAAIVELGGNDGLRGIPPTETKANLEAILARLKSAKVRILLTGMLAPPNMGESYESAFNALFPELARRYNVAFYPFLLDGVAAQPALNQPDGIHPNDQGVAVLVDRLAPYVVRLLDRRSR
jgi:acyl-CoA thioesterase I